MRDFVKHALFEIGKKRAKKIIETYNSFDEETLKDKYYVINLILLNGKVQVNEFRLVTRDTIINTDWSNPMEPYRCYVSVIEAYKFLTDFYPDL